MPCVYDRQELQTPASAYQPIMTALPHRDSGDTGPSRLNDAVGDGDQGVGPIESTGEPPEARPRRMLELELMHFYITETGPSLAFDEKSSHELYAKAIPRMALKSDAVLYSAFAFATLHQTKTTGGEVPSIPSPTAAAVARQRHKVYLELAFQHHHQELGRLSHSNVDGLVMTACLLRLLAFVILSERNLEPYTPPMEWLRITQSHARIFRAAWDLVGHDSTTQTAKLIRATPVVWDYDEREGADKRRDLQHILLPLGEYGEDEGGGKAEDDDDPATWDAGVRRAYESTLSYIGGIWQAVRKNQPLGPIGRRLVLFPMLVDKRFIELVGEAKPRALVVLAHYFALMEILRSWWYIGNTGSREVRAIAAHLPARWQTLLEWPLRMVEEGLPYAPDGGKT